ncbi:Facilitated trehalose transporter Tret1 [Chamberlinius hualienensis]
MDRGNLVVHAKLLLICSIALIGSLSVGGVISYTSPAIPSLNGHINGSFYMNRKEESWFASIVHIGIAGGAIAAGSCNHLMGRKWTMILGTLPFVTGWLIIGTADDIIWMYIGRIITGFCSGLMMATVSIYLVEMTPDQRWRGLYGSGHEVMVNVGVLLTYAIGAAIIWRYLAITLAAVQVLMLILLVYFLPETPAWLLAHGHKERAKKILSWIYKEEQQSIIWCEMEANEISNTVTRTPWIDFFKTPLRSKLLKCLTLFFLQEFSGSNVFRLYTVAIFDLAKTPLDSNTETIIIGAFGVIGAIICAGLADKTGRRYLLMVSMLTMGVSNIILGVYFVKINSSSDIGMDWVPLVCLVLFTLGYSTALGPLPYVILVESFPISARSRACAVAVACEGLCAFVVSKYFVVLGALVENYVPFFVCGSTCMIGFVFVYVFISETKHSNLENNSVQTATLHFKWSNLRGITSSNFLNKQKLRRCSSHFSHDIIIFST